MIITIIVVGVRKYWRIRKCKSVTGGVNEIVLIIRRMLIFSSVLATNDRLFKMTLTSQNTYDKNGEKHFHFGVDHVFSCFGNITSPSYRSYSQVIEKMKISHF